MRVRSKPPLNFSGPEPLTVRIRSIAHESRRLATEQAGQARTLDEPAVAPADQAAAADPSHQQELAAEPKPDTAAATPEAQPATGSNAVAPAPSPSTTPPPTVVAVEEDFTPQPRPQAAGGRFQYAHLVALIASALWIGGVGSWAAYQYGLGEVAATPLNIAMLALFALTPVGLVFIAAAVAREGAQLAQESIRARSLSEAMVAPAALASERTAEVVRDIRTEVADAVEAAQRANAELDTLRAALAAQTQELRAAASEATRASQTLSSSLAHERQSLSQLGERLDAQAAGVVQAVERQTQVVANASDLAQAQLRESEASLTARAADLAAAAGEAQDAARLASDDLARQTLRLEAAGAGVSEQVRAAEDGLAQQRAALVAAAFSLRADQEDFSALVETQRAQLAEALTHTQLATGDLTEASSRSGEALREFVSTAAEQVRTMADLADEHRSAFDAQARDLAEQFRSVGAEVRAALVEEANRGLEALGRTAAETREVAAAAADDIRRVVHETVEQTRRAANEAAEQARAKLDRLAEAAFEASRQADQTFESATQRAQALTEQSAALLDSAGQRSGQRLESNLAAVRAAAAELDATLEGLDARTAKLPAEARESVQAIRASVEAGLEALSHAARRAAEETEAVEAAFQARVKRNYDMLSETVRLMSVVSGGGAQAGAQSHEPAPLAADATGQAPSSPASGQRRRSGAARTAHEGTADAALEAAGAGLRPKLQLQPTVNDQEVRSVFVEGGEARPTRSDSEGWTWRDLLAGMDEPRAKPSDPEPAPLDEDSLTDRMIDEIGALGVDPNALLPRARIDEAGAGYMSDGRAGARQTTRRVAPAAVRRIQRRFLADRALRGQARTFLDAFQRRLDAAARGEAGERTVAIALNTPAGRAFLLVEAALGDAA